MSNPVETPAVPAPEPEGRLGPIGRARASLMAIEVLMRLREDQSAPTDEDLAALRNWPGWGPLAPALSERREGTWAQIGEQLQLLLSPREYRQAEQGTPTAYYTPDRIAQACWAALRDLNFHGGRILEPGCGAGTFIRHTPARMPVQWYGVERDPTTAGIAALLHPNAQIVNARLQDAALQTNSVDAVLGNVPYGNFAVHDKTAPKAVTDSIHNYFIWRSVQALRPGGIAILLTSRYTMDSQDDSARRAIAKHADLLGAVRLPNGALAEGGTEVLADILVVRRRDTDAPPDDSWMEISEVPTVSGQYVNDYFLAHPENVLGAYERGRAAQYGHTLAVKAPEGQDLDAALRGALDGITAAARAAGRDWRVVVGAQPWTEETLPFPVREDGRKEGSFHLVDGKPHEVVDGELVAVERAGQELPKLIALRDATLQLIEAETDHDTPDTQLDPLRAEVNRLYDAYVRKHGPINRYTLAEGQIDEETGEKAVSRRYPRLGGFRRDPDVVAVLALEDFDDETQTADKAPLLLRRVNRRIERPTSAETPEEALSLCLNFQNRIDVPTIAQLLGIEEGQVQGALGELVFPDPDTGDLMTRGAYLSGPVVDKLERAEFLLSQGREDLQRHVDALREVQPEPLPPEDIRAKFGVTWIPVEDVTAFAEEMLGVQVDIVHVARTATWTVDQPMTVPESATNEWGTNRVNAFELLDLALNGQAPKVYDTFRTPDGGSKRVRNDKETMLAESKQTALARRFASWVWEDPERADRLAADYNHLFNSTVLPKHDGSHLTVDGIDPDFVPYSHQWDFVQRVLSAEEGSLCPYPVGAGKTATMFMTAMKLKQLGLVNKPMIVVPNHLLEQISRDGKKLFQNAKILMAGKKDLADARSRMLFAARCATGDWDAIVMTHGSFGRLSVHPVTEATYLEELANEYRIALSAIDGDDANQRRIKDIAKMVDRFDARASDLRSKATDAGVSFENLGADFIQVDEAHLFKNLALPAVTEGMSLGKPSKRSTDLDLKLIVTRERTGRDNVTALYSGTFISNSVREMYVFQHYAMPKRLKKLGLGVPDAWAANHINFESRPEVGVDGVSFRLKRRPVDYSNADEALALFAEVAELRPPESFDIKRPKRVDRFVEIEPTPNLIGYVGSISDRIDLIQSGKVKPWEDNMLNVITDGRKAALDLELVGMVPDGPGKAGAIVRNVLQVHKRTKDLKLPGDPDDVAGGLQLIFCDLGTPSKERGSQVYGKIRRGLIDGLPEEGLPGIPRERIRFIHDYNSDLAKEQLFTEARAGKISVLLMSSAKGGTGVNVQTRGVALHHADPPHRPDEWEQREGRLWRPGNGLIGLDMEVEFYRYLALNSFDSYMFQQLERKQRPIVQILSGHKVGRVIQEIDPVGASFGQAKAIVAGNPLLLELADVNGELTVLLNEADGHRQAQGRLRRKIDVLTAQIREAQSTLPGMRAMADAVVAAGDDATWRTADGRAVDPEDVPGLLAQTVQGSKPTLDLDAGYLWRGINVGFTWHRYQQFGNVAYEAHAHLVAAGHEVDIRLNLAWLGKGQSWRIVKALTEAADAAVNAPIEVEEKTAGQRAALEDAQSYIGRPFDKRDQLEAVRERKAALEARIEGAAVASGNESGSGPQFDPGAAGAEMTEAELAMHDAAAMAGTLGGTAVVVSGGQLIGGARAVDAPQAGEAAEAQGRPPAPEMREIAAILRYYEPLFQRDGLTGTAAAADYVSRPGYGYEPDPDNPLHGLIARMNEKASQLAGVYRDGPGTDRVMYEVGLPRLEASRQLDDIALTLTNRLTYTGWSVGSVDLDTILAAEPGTVIDLPPLPERSTTSPGEQDSPDAETQQATAPTPPSPVPDSGPVREEPVAPAADPPPPPAQSAPAASMAQEASEADSDAGRPPLQDLIDTFGDRVVIGHIGGPQPARTHQSAGWAIMAVLSEDQVRNLVSAVAVDSQQANTDLGHVPTDRVQEWIAEQRQSPVAAFYASTSTELPPALRGDGDVRLSTNGDGLTVDQGDVSTTILWEELPAWIDAAVAHDTANRSPYLPAWRYGRLDHEIHFRLGEGNRFEELALEALADALRESAPPTDEQLAEARERFASPAAPEAAAEPAGITEDTPEEESTPQDAQQLPEQAKPVPGTEGYHYTEEGRTVLLYTEDGEQVGAAGWSYSKYRYEGDVRGDVVRGTDDGATVAKRMANHHAVVYGDRVHRPPLDDQGRDPVWILHNGSDTLVFGVQPEDDTARAAMWTGGGFKESRKVGGFYLPRTWKEPTRKQRVNEAVRVLAAAGRTVTVHTSKGERQQAPQRPARLPELNVTAPNLDEVPRLPDAPPLTAQDDVRDVERLEGAYERWRQQPTVVAYLNQDHDARPNGYGDPDNPVAQLHYAYTSALAALRRPVPGGPGEIVRRIYSVAAWCQALEPAVDADLLDPLQEVYAAAHLLAARAQATVGALTEAQPAPAEEAPAAAAEGGEEAGAVPERPESPTPPVAGPGVGDPAGPDTTLVPVESLDGFSIRTTDRPGDTPVHHLVTPDGQVAGQLYDSGSRWYARVGSEATTLVPQQQTAARQAAQIWAFENGLRLGPAADQRYRNRLELAADTALWPTLRQDMHNAAARAFTSEYGKQPELHELDAAFAALDAATRPAGIGGLVDTLRARAAAMDAFTQPAAALRDRLTGDAREWLSFHLLRILQEVQSQQPRLRVSADELEERRRQREASASAAAEQLALDVLEPPAEESDDAQPSVPQPEPAASVAPSGPPAAEQQAAGAPPNPVDSADSVQAPAPVIVQTPDGPGTVLGTDDGDLVLVTTQSGTRIWNSSDLQWPGAASGSEDAARAAKERQNAADAAQAATAEGIELPLSDGDRLVDLDVEAGHGTVVDADGAVIGWVRARTGDDGRRAWWAQSAYGGPPHNVLFHEDLPPAAGVPALRAADCVRSSTDSAFLSPVPAEYAVLETRLTPAQIRELQHLLLDATYSDGRRVQPPEWTATYREYVLDTVQMQALADAARVAADALPNTSAGERRRARVLHGVAERFEFEVYDTARRGATILPIGEADPYAGPYRADSQPEQPESPQQAQAAAETAPAPVPADALTETEPAEQQPQPPGPRPAVDPATMVNIGLATGAEGVLVVQVEFPDSTLVRPVPGTSTADVPDASVPFYLAVYLPPELATPSVTLVSEAEVDAWLDPLVPSAVASVWSVPVVRSAMVAATTVAIRDAMAPTYADVGAWLLEAAAADPALTELARTGELPEFLAAYQEFADSLVANSGSAYLDWAYQGREGYGRRQVMLDTQMAAYLAPGNSPAGSPPEAPAPGAGPADTTAPVPAPAENTLPAPAGPEAEGGAGPAPLTPAPDPALTATVEPVLTETEAAPAADEGTPTDLVPSETPQVPAPARRTGRQRTSQREPAAHPGAEGAPGDGRLGVYGHAGHGDCDRCGTPDDRYTVVWAWHQGTETGGSMAAECSSCVELTTGVPTRDHQRLADLAEVAREGRRIAPVPHVSGDVQSSRTAANEWTFVHQPTGKRYRLSEETPSGYRGYVLRDLYGISQGTGIGTSSGHELAERAALGRTAQTHPTDSDDWVRYWYSDGVSKLPLHDGERITAEDGEGPRRRQAPFEHGPRWSMAVGAGTYQVELVYQQGPLGEDGHRLEVTSPGGASTRHVEWDGVLEWARERERLPEPAQAAVRLAATLAEPLHLTDLGPHPELSWAEQPSRAPDEPRATESERRALLGMPAAAPASAPAPREPRAVLDSGDQLDLFATEAAVVAAPAAAQDQVELVPPTAPEDPAADAVGPGEGRTGWGFVEGEEITYTGQWDGRYEITLPGGMSYLLFNPSIEHRRTKYAVSLNDQPPGITPKRLRRFDTPDEIMPWVRAHASKRQSGYVFRDGAWAEVPVDTEEELSTGPAAEGAATSTAGALATQGRADENRDQQPQEEAVADEPEPAPAAAGTLAAVPPEEEVTPAAGPAVDVEDPPAPRAFTEVAPLAADDAYLLRLTSVDLDGPREGELLYGEIAIAAVRLSDSGRWFAQMTIDGLPAEVTALNDSPQEAAHQGALMFAMLTGEPYGEAPAATEARGGLTRADVLRVELRAVAEQHLLAVSGAAARANPDHLQDPLFQALSDGLGRLAAADVDNHGSQQMSVNLTAVQEAASAWGAALPADPALDERRHLAFPLLHLLHDTAHLRGRLQATLTVMQNELSAAREREAAVVPDLPPGPAPVPAPDPVRGPQVALSLRGAAEGQVVLGVEVGEVTRALVLPGVTAADLPGQVLPAGVDVPLLVRPARLTEQLVADEEVETWLAAQLADGPLAPAWNNAEARAVLVVVARDALRDSTAPGIDDVAAWLVDTAAEQDGLLAAAHAAADLEEFGPLFARAADALVASGNDERLLWTYLGEDGARRDQVLALATPRAYEQLLALPAPAASERAADATLTNQPAPLPDEPEDTEMATPARPATPEGPEATVPAPAAEQGEDQPAQADPAPAVPPAPAEGEPMPLWTGPQESAGPVEDGPVDVVGDFTAVQEAWNEHVPASEGGTGDDLFASLEDTLTRLEALLAEAVGDNGPAPEPQPVPAPTPTATAPAPAPVPAPAAAPAPAPAAAVPPSGAEKSADDRDPQQAAAAVNTALRHADTHAPALQDLPEWQRIQSVRGAVGHLMRVMREKAGEHFGKLMADNRVGDFVRRVSIRACEKIAGWAQAGADRLRRTDERRELPSAEALLRLGDAALQYRKPRRGDGAGPSSPGDGAPQAVTVEIPALRKMGEALARPMPSAQRGGVSAAAARGRSTTTGKRAGKKASSGTEQQAGHLRRAGADQQQARKPNQR